MSNSDQTGPLRIPDTKLHLPLGVVGRWRKASARNVDAGERKACAVAGATKLGTILVVDDNRDIRGAVRMLLEAAGYSVVTAGDGEEGLRRYEQHQSSIVLVLTDVMMPNMNGIEMADRVLRIDSRLPVLFMSGSAWSAYRGLGCLAKPFRPAELIERVACMVSAGAHSATTASAA